MKTQLFALLELKKIDEKALRLAQEMERLPQVIQNLEVKLAGKKDALDAAKAKLDTTEKRHRQLESDLKEKDSMLQRAESKLMQITNNDEMVAAQKEVENQKKEKASIEEDIVSTTNELEDIKKRCALLEEEFAPFEKGILEDLTRLGSEKAKLEGLRNEQLQKQEGALKNVDRAIGAIYEKISLTKKGSAIVTVESGMCIGCNMRVRPQIYNEILSMRLLHRCTNCGRILLPPGLENELAKGV